MELSEALGDLRDGIASPLLAAVAKRGRPPDTSTIWRLRCKICCYIEYLSPTEIPSEQTITNLVKKHRKVLVSRREVDLASAISSWQKSFAMDEIWNTSAVSSYKYNMARLEQLKLKTSFEHIRKEADGLLEVALMNAPTRLLLWRSSRPSNGHGSVASAIPPGLRGALAPPSHCNF